MGTSISPTPSSAPPARFDWKSAVFGGLITLVFTQAGELGVDYWKARQSISLAERTKVVESAEQALDSLLNARRTYLASVGASTKGAMRVYHLPLTAESDSLLKAYDRLAKRLETDSYLAERQLGRVFDSTAASRYRAVTTAVSQDRRNALLATLAILQTKILHAGKNPHQPTEAFLMTDEEDSDNTSTPTLDATITDFQQYLRGRLRGPV